MILFILSLLLFSSIDAFAPRSIQSKTPLYSSIGQTTVFASSISRNDNNFMGKVSRGRKQNKNTIENELFNEIRQELIRKYVSVGRTQENAETEVDTFLRDTQRSGEYLEMRMRAKQESDLGFEEILQYALAFAIGVFTNFAAQYYLENSKEILNSSEIMVQ